jgi:hypothetical protein
LFLGRARVTGDVSVKQTNDLEEAAQPGASVSEVARRYGIDRRILCRWRQELSPPAFVAVEITDVAVSLARPVS